MKEHICEVCGKPSFKKYTADHKTVCHKHYRQYRKHKKFLDNNPRTIYDRNEIRIVGDTAYMDLYDAHGNVIATTEFDKEDIPKVRYTKWKLSGSGYVMNTPKHKGSNKHFSRTILGTDQFVDHKDNNPLNNHKSNLRICTKSTNAMNQPNVKGVNTQKDGRFYAHIKKNQKMINLGIYIDIEEAQWARWYAERIVFKEFARPATEPIILESRKRDIAQYVDKKVQRL